MQYLPRSVKKPKTVGAAVGSILSNNNKSKAEEEEDVGFQIL
jgi:hypothetical protein